MKLVIVRHGCAEDESDRAVGYMYADENAALDLRWLLSALVEASKGVAGKGFSASYSDDSDAPENLPGFRLSAGRDRWFGRDFEIEILPVPDAFRERRE